MHLMNDDTTCTEKAEFELHKNITSYIEQSLEAAPVEAVAVQPLDSHH